MLIPNLELLYPTYQLQGYKVTRLHNNLITLLRPVVSNTAATGFSLYRGI
ncbi:hypothetical protein VCRA2123O444_90133 [Vibrio crassostreae]|nr:hypothetical protein VCRA2119O430_100034 [Vibrio crassostreae]CAK1706128.1 hypothetical protein VCRA2113O409_100131 [Vibrio crassostreae]CAK1712233.1 hypothetical protein VCRA2117O428_110034 [Vibrio crassostreae]CAK1713160.1 hypothetical protein VCRA2113O416_110034 [Vibrio crassostreae]CAK1715479.1 hypothetical protein VCRA2113O411_110035 [Vibrio crassostreae]